jgi:hypothetical protein
MYRGLPSATTQINFTVYSRKPVAVLERSIKQRGRVAGKSRTNEDFGTLLVHASNHFGTATGLKVI